MAGKVHDARVLGNSGLYCKGQNSELFPDVSMTFAKLRMLSCYSKVLPNYCNSIKSENPKTRCL